MSEYYLNHDICALIATQATTKSMMALAQTCKFVNFAIKTNIEAIFRSLVGPVRNILGLMIWAKKLDKMEFLRIISGEPHWPAFVFIYGCYLGSIDLWITGIHMCLKSFAGRLDPDTIIEGMRLAIKYRHHDLYLLLSEIKVVAGHRRIYDVYIFKYNNMALYKAAVDELHNETIDEGLKILAKKGYIDMFRRFGFSVHNYAVYAEIALQYDQDEIIKFLCTAVNITAINWRRKLISIYCAKNNIGMLRFIVKTLYKGEENSDLRACICCDKHARIFNNHIYFRYFKTVCYSVIGIFISLYSIRAYSRFNKTVEVVEPATANIIESIFSIND